MIVWCRSAKSKKPMPLDAVPQLDGTIETKRGKLTGEMWGRAVPKAERVEGQRYYKSHFATCPHGPAHRRSRGDV